MLSFARWCRRERIAVVHTCDLYANIFGLPAAKLAGVPVRIGSRRELNPDKTAGQIVLQRQAYRCATKVVANSTAARDMLEQEGLAGSSIAVIPNGIDAAAFGERSPDAATRPIRTVITVANLRPEKSHETLLAAASTLVREHPELHFQIVGAGPRRQELEALAASRGVSAHVSFLGHREDVASLLAGADVFVLPSLSEAFPNGAIEAMAAGLPVVASSVGGLLDLIDTGHNGILVQPGDPEHLASAIAPPDRRSAAGNAPRPGGPRARHPALFVRPDGAGVRGPLHRGPAGPLALRRTAGGGCRDLTNVRDCRPVQLHTPSPRRPRPPEGDDRRRQPTAAPTPPASTMTTASASATGG